MKSLIEILCSPHIVAHFQRVCGLQWKDPDPVEPIFPRLSEHEDNKGAFTIKSKFMLCIMQIGSELAGEPFYYTFLPVCSWVLDIGVARKTLTSLALIMYIGQSAKDILREKRPASPPVIRLEAKYETEYGMPSTHAVASTVAPFALYSFTRMVYQIPESRCFILACIWTNWVAISRIYLGMHNAQQVLYGVVGAGSLLHYSLPYMNSFDAITSKSCLATALVTVGCIVLSWVIFQLDAEQDSQTGQRRWNTARGDQVEIMGFTAGFLVGSKWAISQSLYIHRSIGKSLIQIPSQRAMDIIGRMIIGGLVILPISFVIKKIAIMLFAKLSNVPLSDETAAKRNPKIELPYKFLSTFLVGTLCSSFAPWLFNKWNMW